MKRGHCTQKQRWSQSFGTSCDHGDSDTSLPTLIHNNVFSRPVWCNGNHCTATSADFCDVGHHSANVEKWVRASAWLPWQPGDLTEWWLKAVHTWHEVETSAVSFVGGVVEEKAMAWMLGGPAFSPISVTNCVTLAKSLQHFWTPVPLVSKTKYVESCHFQFYQVRIFSHAE